MSPTRLLLAGLVVATPSCLVLDGFGDLEPAESTTGSSTGAGGASSSAATSQTVGGGGAADTVQTSSGSGGGGEGGSGSGGDGGSGGTAPIGDPTLVVPIGHTGDAACRSIITDLRGEPADVRVVGMTWSSADAVTGCTVAVADLGSFDVTVSASLRARYWTFTLDADGLSLPQVLPGEMPLPATTGDAIVLQAPRALFVDGDGFSTIVYPLEDGQGASLVVARDNQGTGYEELARMFLVGQLAHVLAAHAVVLPDRSRVVGSFGGADTATLTGACAESVPIGSEARGFVWDLGPGNLCQVTPAHGFATWGATGAIGAGHPIVYQGLAALQACGSDGGGPRDVRLARTDLDLAGCVPLAMTSPPPAPATGESQDVIAAMLDDDGERVALAVNTGQAVTFGVGDDILGISQRTLDSSVRVVALDVAVEGDRVGIAGRFTTDLDDGATVHRGVEGDDAMVAVLEGDDLQILSLAGPGDDGLTAVTFAGGQLVLAGRYDTAQEALGLPEPVSDLAAYLAVYELP